MAKDKRIPAKTIPAADVSLSLPREDWEWLLGHLAGQYYACSIEVPKDKQREAWLGGLLFGKLQLQKAAQAAGTATQAANVVLDEMKYLDPPEPIAGGSR